MYFYDDRVSARRAVFEQYVSLLQDNPHIQWMPEADFGRSTRWLTALNFVDTDVDINKLCYRMSEEKIEVRPLWKPMHKQPVFSEYAYYQHGDSVSDALFANGVCLPSGSNLTEQQVTRVATVLENMLEKN
ncbi:MAG TPA: hypothetical protein EYP39_07100 [Ghiorsea sp.]|nr:hypothetical protein [Ghiorsea sp.]